MSPTSDSITSIIGSRFIPPAAPASSMSVTASKAWMRSCRAVISFRSGRSRSCTARDAIRHRARYFYGSKARRDTSFPMPTASTTPSRTTIPGNLPPSRRRSANGAANVGISPSCNCRAGHDYPRTETSMIELKDLCYARLGASDLDDAESFSIKSLGLQVTEHTAKSLYLRSDDRAHTLCYFEGDPADQTVGYEVEDEHKLTATATTLDELRHAVHVGTATECSLRKVSAFIGFKDPTGNQIELAARPERSGKRYFATRDAGITGFSHVGLYTTDPARDERF